MSVEVAAYPTTAFRQTPIGWPVSLFNPPTQKPLATVLKFSWTIYFALLNQEANIGVNVDLSQGGTPQGNVLDKIVTVKIDNSNSFNTILVYFQDTGDTISCAPQTIVTFPCVTNGPRCTVIAQGLATGFLPLTTITFYNYFVPPSVDPVVQLTYPQEIGSPSIQRNATQILTPGYGSPALGDQFTQSTVNATGADGNVAFLPAVAAGGFYYLTHLNLTANSLSVTAGSPSVDNYFQVLSTGAAGLLYESFIRASVQGIPFAVPLQIQKANIKLDALQTWICRIKPGTTVPNGIWQLTAVYSYNTR